MNRTHEVITEVKTTLVTTKRVLVGPLVALGLAASLLFAVSAPSQAAAATSNPATHRHHIHPMRVSGAQRHLVGGCIRNYKTKVLMCAIGTHKYYRLVKVHNRWKTKAFWQARVSTQHCSTKKCWGRAREWTMPSRFHYGKPVRHNKTMDMVAAGSGDCPMSLFGVSPMCSVPWSWANDAVTKVTQEVIGQVIHPCVNGGKWGLLGYGAADLWTRIFWEDGAMTAAEAGSKFAGPWGYAITAAATCTVAIAQKGGAHLPGGLGD